jgi:ribosomal protein L23
VPKVFGPEPRDYHFKLNKKVKDLARRSALTYKAKDGAIKVLDSAAMSAPKTSEFAALLKAFELGSRKAVGGGALQGRERAAQQPQHPARARGVASELNTYDIMNAQRAADRQGRDRPAGSHPHQVSHEPDLIRPIVTEKMTAQGEKENRYGFVVARDSNKVQIKQAVEKEYNVKVTGVRTMIVRHGKRRTRYTKSHPARPHQPPPRRPSSP